MNAHQWGGIAAYASLVLGFYLLQMPAMASDDARLALEVCYGAVALVAAGAFVKAASVDPADDDGDDPEPVLSDVRPQRARGEQALPHLRQVRRAL